MTLEEIAGLLRLASSMDPWLGQTSAEEGAVMITGWAAMLAPVEPTVALAYVSEHYGQAGARTLQPGDVLDAWRRHCASARESEERAGRVREQAQSAAELVPGLGGSLGLYLRTCLETVAAGGTVEDVPLPENRLRLDVAQDRWGRRCAFHALCACTHDECRAGWLDAPAQVVDGHGRAHEAAKRCPVCVDAILMAGERGLTSRRRARR